MNIPRLRYWFGFGAIAVALISVGFYLYGQYRIRRALQEVPAKLGINIQQSTEGFTLSKSEGGRTLFQVSAKKALQFSQGGKAELHDVNIVVYGRKSDRFDQIYGERFEYNPQTGDIIAQGEVHIDLESHAEGPRSPDQAPPTEMQNPIHLKTSGVVFNQKTGFAATDQVIEFRIPQASGSAKGAFYDSKNNIINLQSQVRLKTTGKDGAVITAEHGTITAEPRRAVLSVVKVERPNDSFTADQVQVFLNQRNEVERLLASEGVQAVSRTANLRAPQAEFFLSRNRLNNVVVSGGVTFAATGSQPAQGSAQRLLLTFKGQNELDQVQASGNANVIQPQKGKSAETVEIAADTVTAFLRQTRLDRAETQGRSQIAVRPAAAGEPTTTITAGRFDVDFDARGRMRTVRGQPDARIVSSTPGQPDRVSTSRELSVTFAPQGGIANIVQQGNMEYVEGQRKATAERGRYLPNEGVLVLTGSPRVSEGGLLLTANTVRVNRKTGDANAEGDVKTTYNDVRPQPSGALLAAGDPIHVTAAAVAVRRDAQTARYSGGARLWQGANIVQAPVITFDRGTRDVLAEGQGPQSVSTVFVQADNQGRVTPVNVTGSKLSYQDALRRARFEGGVVLKGADATMTAGHIDVFLLPQGQARPGKGPASPSQLERVLAEGDVEIQQASRRAQGDRLTYTPQDGRFVLVGGPPSIFDAERGYVRGDSLTFYSRDGRVVVGSNNSTRTVTQTRVDK